MTAREQVASALSEAGVTMTAEHVPTSYEPKRKSEEGYWPHVAWKCTITRGGSKLTTDYKQGLGHLPTTIYPRDGKLTIDGLDKLNRVLAGGRLNTAGMKLNQPDIADVVYSLISDASAADYEKFEDYARDMGGNPDSRKEYDGWQQCRNIALDLNRVLGAQLLETLKPLTQEM